MADRNGYIGRAPGDNPVIIARQTYNPTGVQTNFTFDSGYTPGYLDVYLNGVKLVVATDYTATDTSIVGLTSAAQNGDILEFVAYKAFDIASVGTAEGNFTVGTDLTVTRNATIGGDATVTGDISGRNFTGVAATFTGNVTVDGILTYEDVTSVDSLGILTARTGVHVLAGGVDVDAGGLNVVGVTTLTQLTSGPAVITGISTFSNVVVGGATTELVVTGDARVTGILTVGTASLTLNGTTGAITGGSLTNAEVAAISSEISDTAVDVFVYDTRKDSDGGAWRKRTQHTSWYNETLNTATRGSRREFPAVAVIVSEANQVTIYDGDDPDLPMWMVFNESSNASAFNLLGYSTRTSTVVAALNAEFMFCSTSDQNQTYFNLISDYGFLIYDGGSTVDYYNGNIGQRNDGLHYRGQSVSRVSGGIVDRNVNDVAMTVLPNAPIDSATGLPISTIAVGTNGGVSVINDDGIVYNYDRGGSAEFTGSVAFDESNDLIISWGTSSGGYRHITRITNLSSSTSSLDTTYGYVATDGGLGSAAAGGTAGVVKIDNIGRHFGIDYDSAGGGNTDDRLGFLHLNASDTSKSLVAFATTSYNTGWMHGDIKGAFLSDTTVESLTANTNLASSATQTATARLTSETYTDGATSWQMVDNAGNDNGYLAIVFGGLTAGQNYHLSMTVDANAALDAGYEHKIEQGVDIIYLNHWNGTGAATLTANFTAVSGTNALYFYVNAITVNVTNFNIRAVDDEDRSVNNNGLAVYGTITKSAVATGADLVAYSGFSASNYLLQPYNSDLDFGTGDFCYMCWVKDDSVSAGAVIFQRGSTVNSNETVFYVDSNRALNARVRTTSNVATTSANVFIESAWNHCIFLRRGGIVSLFHNGIEVASVENTQSTDQSGEGLSIGAWLTNNSYFVTAISLFKVSASAPSAEQIKKMYEDEKVLFQENSQATLYGSTDTVTALGYDEDTNLLHVGTSSGRSDFQGLRRINNTTTAVTTAISASNSLVAEQ